MLDFLDLDVERYDFSTIDSGRVSSNSSFNSSKGKFLVKNEGISKGNVGRYKSHLSIEFNSLISTLFNGFLFKENLSETRFENSHESWKFWFEIAAKVKLDEENFNILKRIASENIGVDSVEVIIEDAKSLPQSYLDTLKERNQGLAISNKSLREQNKSLREQNKSLREQNKNLCERGEYSKKNKVNYLSRVKRAVKRQFK